MILEGSVHARFRATGAIYTAATRVRATRVDSGL